jgi:hypothetical protein
MLEDNREEELKRTTHKGMLFVIVLRKKAWFFMYDVRIHSLMELSPS